MKLIEMIKEHDDKFEELLTSHENLLCAFGRLVDDIIDKDLGLCVDYKLLEKAVELLDKENWMDSTRNRRWAKVVQGLSDVSVQKLTMTKLVDQEEEKLEEDYRVAQLKGEV
tara:strand:- start:87 stop:422 length:336 start_codon:yes stop_codon:yes gene_type:complete